MKAKPEGWETSLKDCINEGKNFKVTNAELVKKYGPEGAVGGSTYRKHRDKLTGGPDVDNKLGAIGEATKEEPKAKAPRPAWNKTKQTAADTSKLATLINKGMYAGLMPLCKNKKLQENDVLDINLGGAVVGTVQYFIPNVNLEHPLILLATRGIILYLKFKSVCNKVAEIKDKITSIGGDQAGPIKQEWLNK